MDSLKLAPSSRWVARLAVVFLVSLFAVNVYRALTQAVVCDEAFSYRLFLSRKPRILFTTFDANYHVLHTWLTYASVKALGISAITLRIPSLAACILYFAAVYRISRRWFGTTPLLLLSVTLLTINPFVLDFMSVARGYGMALAFFSWAMSEALCASVEEPRVLLRIGILLALSVACNLTFVYPASALAVLIAGTVLCSRNSSLPLLERAKKILYRMAAPGLAVALVILVLPLSHIRPNTFYVGTDNLFEMTASLLMASLRYHDCDFIANRGCYYPVLYPWGYRVAQALFFTCFSAAAVLFWRRCRAAPGLESDSVRDAGLISAGTLFLTAGFNIATHHLFGQVYPVTRMGLYFLFLVPLCFLAACRWLWSLRSPARAAAWLWTAALVVLAVALASEFDVRYYAEWRYDAGSRDMINLVRKMHGGGSRPVRLAASFPLDMALDYYRQVLGIEWLKPIGRDKPAKGYDYYALIADDLHYIDELQLRKVYVNEVSGSALAVPSSYGSSTLPAASGNAAGGAGSTRIEGKTP